MRILPVKIRTKGKRLRTNAILDSGAKGTLIEAELEAALDLVGPTRDLVFGTFHSQDPVIRSQILNFEICSIDGGHKESVERAKSVPSLNISRSPIDFNNLKKTWPHLSDVENVSLIDDRISVLNGADIPEAHVTIDVRRPPNHQKGPYGILTPFGWCCVESVSLNSCVNRQIFNVIVLQESFKQSGLAKRSVRIQPSRCLSRNLQS